MVLRYYPIGLNLQRKNVLIVGAGRVAQRKIKTLLTFGARVKAVAPHSTAYIKQLAQKGKIYYLKRNYKTSDINGSKLIIAATSDKKINEIISADAKKKGVWINVVDQTSACEFISAAIVRKRGLVVSIFTDGKNPRASKEFKDFLKRKIDEFSFSRD